MAATTDAFMTLEKIYETIENEIECVISADKGCDRDCAFCHLVRPTEEILTAYEISLIGLKELMDLLTPDYVVHTKTIKGSRARIVPRQMEEAEKRDES